MIQPLTAADRDALLRQGAILAFTPAVPEKYTPGYTKRRVYGLCAICKAPAHFYEKFNRFGIYCPVCREANRKKQEKIRDERAARGEPRA